MTGLRRRRYKARHLAPRTRRRVPVRTLVSSLAVIGGLGIAGVGVAQMQPGSGPLLAAADNMAAEDLAGNQVGVVDQSLPPWSPLALVGASSPDWTDLVGRAPTAQQPGADPPVSVASSAQVQVADPVRIRIPSIGVDADVIGLGLNADQGLEVPEDFAQTGWWSGGPEPGEVGPAVIVGHVDSYEGPAVFVDLGQLRRGDSIYVDRADGTSSVFLVRSMMRVGKDRFPTRAVYGPTDGPELRLITCHGSFSAGSYEDNLVVFASNLA